jgi:UDP-N-acetylglucosamine 2-epimerase (non-hydrolysing)
MKKVILVVGARPNFMKIAPLWLEMQRDRDQFEPLLLHTGQHYDYEMSRVFFEDLCLPEPHYFMGIRSGTHAEQTGKIMIECERILQRESPQWVVVVGDVNSTLACSIAAKKLGILVAHVEAGLRSFDMTMPEEMNRKLTDAISDILFTPSRDGDENLLKEGINPRKINFVGNIMIDSLITILKEIDAAQEDRLFQRFRLERNNYVLVTLHRPSNVDDPLNLSKILSFLNTLSHRIAVLFPIHPRTQKIINSLGNTFSFDERVKMVEPIRYREFIALEKNAKFIITDSGGIQEETTYLKIPCLTLRPNTERPITLVEGTNELTTIETIDNQIELILGGNWKTGRIPELWDGRTAGRIVEMLRITEI